MANRQLGGQRCSNRYTTAATGRRVGDRCPGRLDGEGTHAATCLVGGKRKQTHNAQRDLWERQLPGAGFAALREQHVPG